MTISEDTSNQPAPLHITTTSGTTASFSPQANTLLVAVLVGDGPNNAAETGSVSDSGSHTWTRLVRTNVDAAGVDAIGGFVDIWVTYLSSAPGSITVTGSWTPTSGANGGNLVVRSLLGAASTQNGATATAAGNGSNTINPTVALTPTVVGSHIYGGCLDYTTNSTLTANSNTTSIDQFNDATNGDTWAVFKGSADTTTLTSTTFGYTQSAAVYQLAAAEILPAASTSTQVPIITPAFVAGRRLPYIRRSRPYALPLPQANTGQKWPSYTTQPGYHPHWLAKRRAALWQPVPPQGPQSQNWPSVTDPPGSRPRWLPKLRRSTWYSPPWPQGTLGVAYPTVTDPAGFRPRWMPKLRRGKYFDPPWPQANQGGAYPTITAQPGVRPRWAPVPRRGRHFSPPWPQATLGQPYPTVTDPSGWRPRWAPRPRRGARFDPPWLQGTLGQNWPSFIDPPGSRPRWAPKLRRGHFYEPPWPQGPLTLPFPAVTHPAGLRPKFAPLPRRGRLFDPSWPQANTGQAWPSQTAPSYRPWARARAGRFTAPVTVTLASPPPGNITQPSPHPRWAPQPRRGRYFNPPWPQGTLGGNWPTFTTQAGPHPHQGRPGRARWFSPPWAAITATPPPSVIATLRHRIYTSRRGRLFDPPWPQGNQGAPWPSLLTQPGFKPHWAPKLRRGRFHEPAWPQGTQGQAWPSYVRQPGIHPRWAPVPQRGHLFDPPWPQGPLGAPVAPFLARRNQPLRMVRRGVITAIPPAAPQPVPQLTGRRRFGFLPTAASRRRFDPPWAITALSPPVGMRRPATPKPVRRARGIIANPPWTPPATPTWLPVLITGRVTKAGRPVRRGVTTARVSAATQVTTRDLILTCGKPTPKWVFALPLPTHWAIDIPARKWTFGGPSVTSLSSLSTEYIQVQVGALVNGVAVNPTGDVVQMAFVAGYNDPQPADWKPASWDTSSTTFKAQCLVGPGGTVTLAKGTYSLWVKVFDNPETPVRNTGDIQII